MIQYFDPHNFLGGNHVPYHDSESGAPTPGFAAPFSNPTITSDAANTAWNTPSSEFGGFTYRVATQPPPYTTIALDAENTALNPGYSALATVSTPPPPKHGVKLTATGAIILALGIISVAVALALPLAHVVLPLVGLAATFAMPGIIAGLTGGGLTVVGGSIATFFGAKRLSKELSSNSTPPPIS